MLTSFNLFLVKRTQDRFEDELNLKLANATASHSGIKTKVEIFTTIVGKTLVSTPPGGYVHQMFGVMKALPRYIWIFVAAFACLSTSCGLKEKAEMLDSLPCVSSLTVVTYEPLHIRVVTSEGSGGVFIREPRKPNTLSSSVDVFMGETFVVHKDRTGYDFKLESVQDGLLKFSTAVVENRGVPQKKIQIVKPYTVHK